MYISLSILLSDGEISRYLITREIDRSCLSESVGPADAVIMPYTFFNPQHLVEHDSDNRDLEILFDLNQIIFKDFWITFHKLTIKRVIIASLSSAAT